jgi:hypothetical protein
MVAYPMNIGQMSFLATKLDKLDKRKIAFRSAHETPEGEQVPSQVLLPVELDGKYAGAIGEARALDVSDPTELDLSKSMAKNQVYLEVSRIGQTVNKGIPPTEEPEATPVDKPVEEDPMALPDRLLLETEASITGESLEDLSKRIIAMADAFRATSGTVAGLRRKYEQLISEAATTAEVEQLLRNFSAEIEGPMDRARNFADKKGA